ncbi:23S rRNA (guanosine(2251)-2'-O)-methyltransferase RlmB [Actinomycetota bacterium]|nr:23S rRNA (guanosine(2251)-2'-O)-methyltransferase RlmB [Actinomycetota bacterium]
MVKQRKPRGATPKASERTWHKNYAPRTKTQGRTLSNSRYKTPRTNRDNIIYGVNPVFEYLSAGTPASKLILSSTLRPESKLQQILGLANNLGVAIYELPKNQIDTICGGGNHQGVVLYSDNYNYYELNSLSNDGKSIIILDHITDPQNLGAVIRSAAAFEANIVIPKSRSVDVNATVWKTSAGNAMKCKISKVANLNTAIEKLKDAGYFIIGLEGSVSLTIADDIVRDNKLVAFVAGNEGAGISQLTAKNCDVLAKIPTAVESLNVAQAISIALYSISQNYNKK